MNNSIQVGKRTYFIGDTKTPILATALFAGFNYYLKPEGLFCLYEGGLIASIMVNKRRVKRAKFGRIGKTKMDYFIGRKQYRLEMRDGAGIIRRVDWTRGGV